MRDDLENDVEAWGWGLMRRQDPAVLARRAQHLKQKGEEVEVEFQRALHQRQNQDAERKTTWEKRFQDLRRKQDEDMARLRLNWITESGIWYGKMQTVRSQLVVRRTHICPGKSLRADPSVLPGL